MTAHYGTPHGAWTYGTAAVERAPERDGATFYGVATDQRQEAGK